MHKTYEQDKRSSIKILVDEQFERWCETHGRKEIIGGIKVLH